MNKGLQIVVAAMVCGTLAGVAAFVVLHKGTQSRIAALEVSEAHVKHELQARVEELDAARRSLEDGAEELALCEQGRASARVYAEKVQKNIAAVRGEYQEARSRIAELEKTVTSAQGPPEPAPKASTPAEMASASGHTTVLDGEIVMGVIDLVLYNNDSFDWRNVTMSFKKPGIEGWTYSCKRSLVRSGTSINVQLIEFTLYGGSRFNPLAQAIQRLHVGAVTPSGYREFTWTDPRAIGR